MMRLNLPEFILMFTWIQKKKKTKQVSAPRYLAGRGSLQPLPFWVSAWVLDGSRRIKIMIKYIGILRKLPKEMGGLAMRGLAAGSPEQALGSM